MPKLLTFKSFLAGLILMVLALAVGLTMVTFTMRYNSPPEIRLTSQDNGRTVTLKKNQLMSLTLLNPVPPWGWEVIPSKEGILERAFGKENRASRGQGKYQIVGNQHDSTFLFRAITEGQVTLTLSVQRRSEKMTNQEINGIFKVQVNVE